MLCVCSNKFLQVDDKIGVKKYPATDQPHNNIMILSFGTTHIFFEFKSWHVFVFPLFFMAVFLKI